jgi:hypothetical protein
MKLNRKLKISKYLQSFFGETTTIFDIALILIVATISLVLVADDKSLGNSLSMMKFTTLQVLAFDISGGIIANFTRGTSKYYNKSNALRIKYIGIHILQPILLYYIFPSELILIISISIFTLISSFVINSIKNIDTQRVVSVFLLVIGFFILTGINTNVEILYVLLLMYMLKLITGFSVRHIQSIKE